jgi:hypothetical protein
MAGGNMSRISCEIQTRKGQNLTSASLNSPLPRHFLKRVQNELAIFLFGLT